MDKCCCTYAQQICPSCGRRAKDVAIFCQEAKRTDVMCSGHRIVDIPGELCPRCSGKRNASRNTPHHYSHAPGNAATVTTGGNTVGRRRLSLTNLLGLTSKGSQSNLQKYVKKPDLQSMVERVSSLGTGTTTAAAWRAQHRDADRFLSTRYDSAEMPPDRVQAEVVLDCVSLPDSQSTIWFPTTERIRAMPGQPATVPTEARRRDTSAQDFLPSPQIQKPGAGLVTRVSASGPLSAPHADDMVQGRQEHVLDRPHDGSQFDRTAGTSLRRMQSDRRSLLGGEPTPPVPERNPRRLNAGTLQRRDSEETTWSALDPKRLSVPGFNTAEPSVADVPCLAIIPRPVQPSISPSTAGEVGLDVRLGSSCENNTHSRPRGTANVGHHELERPIQVSPPLPLTRLPSTGLESTKFPHLSSPTTDRIQPLKDSQSSARRTRRRCRPQVPVRTTSRRAAPPSCSSSVYSQ